MEANRICIPADGVSLRHQQEILRGKDMGAGCGYGKISRPVAAGKPWIQGLGPLGRVWSRAVPPVRKMTLCPARGGPPPGMSRIC